jgi:hypothetical protein
VGLFATRRATPRTTRGRRELSERVQGRSAAAVRGSRGGPCLGIGLPRGVRRRRPPARPGRRRARGGPRRAPPPPPGSCRHRPVVRRGPRDQRRLERGDSRLPAPDLLRGPADRALRAWPTCAAGSPSSTGRRDARRARRARATPSSSSTCRTTDRASVWRPTASPGRCAWRASASPRTVFDGSETIGRLGTNRVVAVVERDEHLGRRVALCAPCWPRPTSPRASGSRACPAPTSVPRMLLDELARARSGGVRLAAAGGRSRLA